MSAIVLACGNALRGDDGIALYIALQLGGILADENAEIVCSQQWLPEQAESLSRADLAIFLDASLSVPGGELRVQAVGASPKGPEVTTHGMSPEKLMVLARELYGKAPKRAYLVAIGSGSFELGSEFSEPVRRAIPEVLKRVKALLSGEPISIE